MATTKQTVLHDWHMASGANMALFGNYDMPLWYKTGARAEHLAVIRTAGIFDTSHMAVVAVQGEGARSLLQLCLSKDLDSCLGPDKSRLIDGRCVYGVFLKNDGTVIDDAIVYQLREDSFMVVVNASMGHEIAGHLQRNNRAGAAQVTDLTDQVGKMDIQGPDSARILATIVKNPQDVFDRMVYFSFKGGFDRFQATGSVELVDGTPVLLSRTGYTGEFGFEIFLSLAQLGSVWNMVFAAGRDKGLLACGLAARDSLRAGAVLPLSHQDIGPWPFVNNPWPFALPYTEDKKRFTKNFIGADALLHSTWQKNTLPFAGFDPRKIAGGDRGYVESESGERIGRILTCTTDMALDRAAGKIVSVAADSNLQARGLCCGLVMLDKRYDPGEQVVLTDGKRKLPVEIRADIRPDRTARKPMRFMID